MPPQSQYQWQNDYRLQYFIKIFMVGYAGDLQQLLSY